MTYARLAIGLMMLSLLGGSFAVAKAWRDDAYEAGIAVGRASEVEYSARALAAALREQEETERHRREADLASQRKRLEEQAEQGMERARARSEAEKSMAARGRFPDECRLHSDDVRLFNEAVTIGRQGDDAIASPAASGPADTVR